MYLLEIISKLYGLITAVRNFLYEAGILRIGEVTLPVISIGNVTAGGNSKTPLCIYIAEKLKEQGKSPVVIMRGYGGSVTGPYLVKDGDSHVLTGDEALLIKEKAKVPVVISARRFEGAQYVEKEKLGDVILLDDAFQHRALKRNLDIISINVSSEKAIQDFVASKLMPAGRFREDREKAFKRAGLVVLARRSPEKKLDISPVRELIPENIPCFESNIEIEGVFDSTGNRARNVTGVYVFCAIANPEGFLGTVRSTGLNITGQRLLRDHQKLSPKLMKELLAEAGSAMLICTEKDAVKVPVEYQDQILVLKPSLKIEPEEVFLSLISELQTDSRF